MYILNKLKFLFIFVILISLIIFLIIYIKENKTNSSIGKVLSYNESNNIVNHLKLLPKSMSVRNNTFQAQGNFIELDVFENKTNIASYEDLPKYPLVINQFEISCDLKTKKCIENIIIISRDRHSPESVDYGDNRYSVNYFGDTGHKYRILSNNLIKKGEGYEGSLIMEQNFEPLECGRNEIIFNFTNNTILKKMYTSCSEDVLERNTVSSEIFAE